MTLIVGVDVESTGLDWEKGDKIVEICALAYRLEDRKLLLDFTRRINPAGQRMNPKAQAVHGISATDLVSCPTFDKIAPAFSSILKRADLLLTFNGESFDLPFIAYEMLGAGETLPGDLMHMDLMREGMTASYDSKPPSLQELCWAMGVEYDTAKAHAAAYDVQVMIEAFFRGLDSGIFKMPVQTEQV